MFECSIFFFVNGVFKTQKRPRVWDTVRDFITFFSFMRLCMKFNTFFAFIKLYFPKIIFTSYNVANIRLLHILHKTFSRPSFKCACVLERVYLN